MTLIAVLGYHLSFGLARLLNLTHAALVAIGAYATAIFSIDLQVPIIAALCGGAAVTALSSLVLSLISSRLPGDSFALATLAVAGIVHALAINWKALTRGVLGIPGIPGIPTLQVSSTGEWDLAVTLLILVIPCFLLVWWVHQGAWGRALRAYGESPEVADSLGISGAWVRNLSLGGGALFAGISGGLYASYISYIDPSLAQIGEMVSILAIVVLGRPGSLLGCVASTIGLVLLPEALRFLPLPSSMLGHLRMLLYATILYGTLFARRNELLHSSREI